MQAFELRQVRIGIEPKRLDSRANAAKQLVEDLAWMDTINQEESIMARQEFIFPNSATMETLQQAWPHTFRCAVDTAGTNSTVERSSTKMNENAFSH